ncbi:MAG: cytochrome c [Bacteroidales bacterium]|nr:cytochrome c [Bacteroidales bacterium]
MKKITFFAGSMFSLAILIGLSSCGGSTETKTGSADETTVKETAVEVKAEAPVEQYSYAQGEKIFNEKCIVCHQANGEGIPGAFPSIKGSEFLKNNRLGAISQVLNGAAGGSTINGIKYTAPMPFQVDTKEDAVAVINYVANHFGNDFGLITIEDVKDVVINPR